MRVSDFAQLLEAWAPPSAAESYDNVGLLVGNPEAEVNGALINLDMTEAVVREAVDRGCNLVIAHHPIWFTGRKRLIGEDYVSRTIVAAVKNDVALYAIHTNLDNVRSGVNARIAERLGLSQTEFLAPKDTDEAYGSGLIGTLAAPMSKKDFLAHVKSAFDCGGIRYADAPLDHVERVAVCGGSGSFLTATARRARADAFVTADITYHKYFDNEGDMLLLDIGHYESEQFTSQLVYEYLQHHLSENFPNFALHLSETYTNPVKYF